MSKEQKKLSKNIRFNYFEPKLIADVNIIESLDRKIHIIKKLNEKLSKYKNNTQMIQKILDENKVLDEENEIYETKQQLEKYEAITWDIKPMLDYISAHKEFKSDIDVDGTLVEIEPNSFITKEDNIISFQITKLRDTFIPAKKKIGIEKEDIMLNDDEYIGEFMSILYDYRLNVLMVQSNRYALVNSKLEKYLTLLRRKYLTLLNESTDNLWCELRTYVDPKKVKEVLNASVYRKLRIKGSDFMLDSFIDNNEESNKFGTIRKLAGKSKGVNFDIILSVNSTKKTSTLDVEEVREVINQFHEQNGKMEIEITKKDSESAHTELVNLLHPRLTDIINFRVSPRQTVGHEYMYQKMIECYKKTMTVIIRINTEYRKE